MSCRICGLPEVPGMEFCKACFITEKICLNPTKVTEFLWLGSSDNAKEVKFEAIDVRPWVEFERPKPRNVHALAILLHAREDQKRPVLLHCQAGSERSPFVMAYFLVLFDRFKTMYKAYTFMMNIRPVVMDRSHWLHPSHLQALEHHDEETLEKFVGKPPFDIGRYKHE